ncbi:hypothetical protein WN51_02721 [Melipona quadrifasciata]|uniref:Uncharacterized protein n=1 Tax=Melipona quadrifasciata TaxID=166423 RepID=A0A0M9A9V9_9HYME|nr:hypothetical protein WN51_02721 [Melipona quadrifasciata]
MRKYCNSGTKKFSTCVAHHSSAREYNLALYFCKHEARVLDCFHCFASITVTETHLCAITFTYYRLMSFEQHCHVFVNCATLNDDDGRKKVLLPKFHFSPCCGIFITESDFSGDNPENRASSGATLMQRKLAIDNKVIYLCCLIGGSEKKLNKYMYRKLQGMTVSIHVPCFETSRNYNWTHFKHKTEKMGYEIKEECFVLLFILGHSFGTRSEVELNLRAFETEKEAL